MDCFAVPVIGRVFTRPVGSMTTGVDFVTCSTMSPSRFPTSPPTSASMTRSWQPSAWSRSAAARTGSAMAVGRPSRTALGAAMYRAVHQTYEGGVIFADPYALQILDDDARAGLPAVASDPAQRSMRLFIAARSRFSEDAMAACVARGVRQ